MFHGIACKFQLGKLKSRDPNQRRAAAKYLGESGYQKAIPALLEALRSKDWFLCREAAFALAQLNATSAVEPLIQILTDSGKDPQLRQVAAVALGKLRDSGAVDPLIRTLREPIDTDMRAAAQASEKMMEQMGEMNYFSACLTRSSSADQCGIIALQVAAREANLLSDEERLDFMDPKKAVARLRQILRDWFDVTKCIRQAAADALAQIGDHRAVPALREALATDGNDGVRKQAQKALLTFGGAPEPNQSATPSPSTCPAGLQSGGGKEP